MIRLFQEKDRQSLQQLFLEVRTKHFFWEDGASFELQDFDLQTQDEIILVAEDEKGILQGFLAIFKDFWQFMNQINSYIIFLSQMMRKEKELVNNLLMKRLSVLEHHSH